jgi:hypothetical protein
VDQDGTAQNRDSRRSPVFLAGGIEVAGVVQPVTLRNFSESGVLIEGDCLPEVGATAYFERKELRLKCRVVWVEGRFAGVLFARPLNPREVLRHIPKPRPHAQPNTRRPGLACRPLTANERKTLAAWMSVSNYTLGD